MIEFRRSACCAITVWTILLFAAAAATAAARLIEPEDIFRFTYLSNSLIAPDGTHILVTATRANGPNDGYDQTIDLIDVTSGRTIHEATGKVGDGQYDWMPDGKSFVFIRREGKVKPQLFRFDLTDSKVTQLTHLASGVSSPAVSHNGSKIALTVVDVDPAPDALVDFGNAGFTPSPDESKSDIQTIDSLFFEANGQGYTYRLHPHVWVVDADGNNAKQLTFGRWSEGFDGWSADDRSIFFNSLQRASVDIGPSDLYSIAVAGGTPRKLDSPEPANYGLFAATDGRVYSLRGSVGDPAELAALVSANADGSDPRVIVAKNQVGWGDSVLADMKNLSGLCASAFSNSPRALVNADGPGYANLRVVDLGTGDVRDLTPARGEAWSCSLSHDDRLAAYLYSDALHPVEAYVVDTSTGAVRQITHTNDALLSQLRLSKPEPFTVSDGAGYPVQAWFMPASGGPPAASRRPTLVVIHGGPETQFGDTFSTEFQYYASLGYNVVFSDPRGSTGHGYAFCEALESDYGNAMFQDVEAVTDAIVRRPDVDGARLGVMGASYGGYATFWVTSHTDRYKAAIAERAVSDLRSEDLAADFAGKNGLGGGMYRFGAYWDPANTRYADFSPLTYVANVHTPLLIVRADRDTRSTHDQGLEEFTALKILGRTATYVVIPNEDHDLPRSGAPIHRVERMRLFSNFLNGYLTPASG